MLSSCLADVTYFVICSTQISLVQTTFPAQALYNPENQGILLAAKELPMPREIDTRQPGWKALHAHLWLCWMVMFWNTSVLMGARVSSPI